MPQTIEPRSAANLLKDELVRSALIDGKTLVLVEVPRAERKVKPVYVSSNPFNGNTYRRRNESDQRLSDEEVRPDACRTVEDSRDVRILRGYGIDDLCLESFRAYRQAFANREPDHRGIRLEISNF